MDPTNMILSMLNTSQVPATDERQNSMSDFNKYILENILNKSGEVSGLRTGNQSVGFEPGAIGRTQKMLGTSNVDIPLESMNPNDLPGSVSQMPATAPDQSYEDNYLSVILPPKEYLKYKLEKGAIDAQKDKFMGDRQIDLLRTLIQSQSADARNRQYDVALKKIDEAESEQKKNESISFLGGYIRDKYPKFAENMGTDNVLFKARDIALQFNDEKLANQYNEAIKYFPGFQPIEFEDIRAQQRANIPAESEKYRREIYKKSIEDFISGKDFDETILEMLAGPQGLSLANFDPKELYGPGTLRYLAKSK
jgi:hypothetical protein